MDVLRSAMKTRRCLTAAMLLCALYVSVPTRAQPQPPTGPSAAELKDAETDTPKLIDVLALRPGMTVADVGAGFGAMAMTLARTLGPTSQVYATDISELALTILRRDKLPNMVVIEGGERT